MQITTDVQTMMVISTSTRDVADSAKGHGNDDDDAGDDDDADDDMSETQTGRQNDSDRRTERLTGTQSHIDQTDERQTDKWTD